jgi:hypothetical protein
MLERYNIDADWLQNTLSVVCGDEVQDVRFNEQPVVRVIHSPSQQLAHLLARPAVHSTKLEQREWANHSKDTILTLIGYKIRSLSFAGTKYRMFGSMSNLCTWPDGETLKRMRQSCSPLLSQSKRRAGQHLHAFLARRPYLIFFRKRRNYTPYHSWMLS